MLVIRESILSNAKKKIPGAIKDSQLSDNITGHDGTDYNAMRSEIEADLNRQWRGLAELEAQLKEYPQILQLNIYRRRVATFYKNNQELLARLLEINKPRLSEKILTGKTHLIEYDYRYGQRMLQLISYQPSLIKLMQGFFDNLFPNSVKKDLNELDDEWQGKLAKFLKQEILSRFIEEESNRLYKLSQIELN